MSSNNEKAKRGSFTGAIGFVMAAAGSAVGLGNIWRFPYLAAKNGGGTFLVVYLVLVLTFGFALLTTEIALGRKTRQGPLTAYGKINKKFAFTGFFAWLVPIIILPYYCTIGGWVLKYLGVFLTGDGASAATDGYFSSYISGQGAPIFWMILYLAITAFIVIGGVEKGIEKYSRILMPILVLLIIGIAIFSLTLSYTDESGVSRTGLQGFLVYAVPNFEGMTAKSFFWLVIDAVGQLFFSISVAMGIMVAYGSYVPKETNLMKSINRIEFFDTLVAFLAGLMIVPAVYTFMGTEGMSAGPGLMFVSLPKVFNAMGWIGRPIGVLFFLMVTFAAVTSSVSIMEAVISGLMDKWHWSRTKSAIVVTVYSVIMGLIVCFGYNILYFELPLPNGTTGQVLDVMDYISNNIFMPLVALLTCILFGWVAGPETITDEVTRNGEKFPRKILYRIMIRYVAPLFLVALLLQSFGVFG